MGFPLTFLFVARNSRYTAQLAYRPQEVADRHKRKAKPKQHEALFYVGLPYARGVTRCLERPRSDGGWRRGSRAEGVITVKLEFGQTVLQQVTH